MLVGIKYVILILSNIQMSIHLQQISNNEVFFFSSILSIDSAFLESLNAYESLNLTIRCSTFIYYNGCNY